MGRKEHTEAFILRAVHYGERDIIATLLTPEWGKVSAVAKNARSSKRFGGGLQLFRKVDALLERRPDRDINLFVEMQVVRDFRGIEKSYEKITAGSYGTELLRELSREGAPTEELFVLLEAFYAKLETHGDDVYRLETILHHFELRLLDYHGSTPSLWGCQRCGLAHSEFERLQCTRTGEGLLCSSCRRPGEAVGLIERDTLTALQYFDRPDGEVPEVLMLPSVRQQARRVLDNSFRMILQRELKSRPMLDTILP
ncbi:MAG: DNA repair protein RecO [Myxococcota bacterium]